MKWRSASSAGQFRLLNQPLALHQVAEFRRTRRVKEGTGSSPSVSAAFGPVSPIHAGNPGLADALGRNLAETYRRIYGDQEPRIASGLDEAARLVIERIANSDALYHNCEHTALVTLCVQDILRGRRLEQTVTPIDWGHTILAALSHDIGYVRGICAGDTAERFVIDSNGNTVTPPRGASDAFLTPYHVERGKIKVRERFAVVPEVDEER